MGGRSFYEDIDSRDIDAALRYNYSIGKMSYSMLLAGENKSDNIGKEFLATRAKFNTSLGIWGLSANFVDTPSLERKSTVFGLDYFNSVFEDVELSAALVASSIKTQDVVNDFGAWLQGIYEVNDRHIHEFTLFSYGDELQLNNAGFVRRVDRRQFEYEYALLFPELESDVIEEISISAEIEAKTNFDNEKLPFQLGLATEFTIFNGAFFEFGIEWLSAGKDDNLTREFKSTNLDASWSVELIYESPEYLFGQIEGELLFGQENWSGRFYEAVFGIKTELLPDVFGEMQISNYRSDSWLNWEDGNIVDEYSFFENAIDFKLNYRASDKHEFRLRLELVAGEASAISGNIIVDDGSRLIGTIPDDFSFSEAVFQFRYKYTLTKQTAVYLSYTFGGEFENDRLEESRRGFFSKAINNKESHNVFLKARLMF